MLEPKWRCFFGRALRDRLQMLDLTLLCVSVSATHAHLLAKMPGGPIPRKWIGVAKKHANFEGKAKGWTGKLWAEGSKPNPINDRLHQVNTFNYILLHLEEGAWVWDFRQGERGAGIKEWM